MNELDIARLWGCLTAQHLELQRLEEEVLKRRDRLMDTALRLQAMCASRRPQEQLQ